MLFLVVAALLYLPTVHGGSLRAHLSDSYRLKCDTLPYRSTYAGDGCYFAVLRQIESRKASEECSSILFGAKLATKPREALFKALMVDNSDFHLDSDSSGSKFIMCLYENNEKCDVDQATLLSGRCLVRAAKKMNFVDARKYCKERGMDTPVPANDLDNRIVRDVLVMDPVWLNVNLEDGLKLDQTGNFSRWSTCENPAKGQNQLYSGSQKTCAKDLKVVIDRHGYWSKSDVGNTMDVICSKNAVNAFTTVAVLPTCEYHKLGQNEVSVPPTKKPLQVEKPVATASIELGTDKTCYVANLTSTRYDILGNTTVETRRGCEVACDRKSNCVAFSFKDAGFSSSCVLLSETTEKGTSDPPTTIFLKKTTGCVARTNPTAELGEDPCVDKIVPSAFQGFGTPKPCPRIKDPYSIYIIRAVDENGRRITLDNSHVNYMRKSGDMFEFVYDEFAAGQVVTTQKVVAFACALAGSKKCPCEPLKFLDFPNSYPGVPDRRNPCNTSNALVWYDVTKSSYYGVKSHPLSETKNTIITCKAGMWHIWKEVSTNAWGVNGIACTNIGENEKPLPAKTCYAANVTSKRYDVLRRITVETQRGCEVACDDQSECVAFSFKDAGLSSSCVLLASATQQDTCDPPSTIFLKKTSGCVARTNATAEFGEDPCVDKIVPSAFRGFGKGKQICPKSKDPHYIIRAIDENGHRITLDNSHVNYMRQSGDMFEFVYDEPGKVVTTQKVVAFACALAGGTKCPCEPLKYIEMPYSYKAYPGTPERINPCNTTNAVVRFDVAKSSFYGVNYFPRAETKTTFITCKAGMWLIWRELSTNSFGVNGIACTP